MRIGKIQGRVRIELSSHIKQITSVNFQGHLCYYDRAPIGLESLNPVLLDRPIPSIDFHLGAGIRSG